MEEDQHRPRIESESVQKRDRSNIARNSESRPPTKRDNCVCMCSQVSNRKMSIDIVFQSIAAKNGGLEFHCPNEIIVFELERVL